MTPSAPAFTRLADLASERLGGRAVEANDEFFAPKESLVVVAQPVFIPGKYTDRGKWMDGWETRRRRQPGHDWCVVRLGVAGEVHGVDVDTTHFKGNHPESCSVDGCLVDGRVGAGTGEGTGTEERARTEEGAGTEGGAPGLETEWTELVPRTPLQPHTSNLLAVPEPQRCSHVRLNIYPDGGVARLRVYGVARSHPDELERNADGDVDLAAALNGGLVLACSDEFFSEPRNLLMPGRGVDMGDGWETRRRRGPGHDWCVVRLGWRGIIRTVEVDTSHFKGNYPARCSLEAADLAASGEDPGELVPGRELTRDRSGVAWRSALPETALGPDQVHRFGVDSERGGPCTHVRFNIFPDGGVGRLRLFGRIAEEAATS